MSRCFSAVTFHPIVTFPPFVCNRRGLRFGANTEFKQHIMKRKMLQQTALAAAVAASALCGSDTQAQSVDALLKKLVEKNVITAKEAEQLKQESDQGFA